MPCVRTDTKIDRCQYIEDEERDVCSSGRANVSGKSALDGMFAMSGRGQVVRCRSGVAVLSRGTRVLCLFAMDRCRCATTAQILGQFSSSYT